MLKIKELLTFILKLVVPKSGATMMGELKTAYNSVVIGAGPITATASLSDIANEIRYSSGAMGKVTLASAETRNGVTVPAGNYSYIYLPHRSGGINGQPRSIDGTDNHNYGNLILMRDSAVEIYDVRIASGSIANLYKISNLYNQGNTTGSSWTAPTTAQYSMYSTSSNSYKRFGRLVIVSFYIHCTAPTKWTSSSVITGLPAPYGGKEVYGGLGAISASTNTSVSVAIQSDGGVKFGGGSANVNYAGLVYYIAA